MVGKSSVLHTPSAVTQLEVQKHVWSAVVPHGPDTIAKCGGPLGGGGDGGGDGGSGGAGGGDGGGIDGEVDGGLGGGDGFGGGGDGGSGGSGGGDGSGGDGGGSGSGTQIFHPGFVTLLSEVHLTLGEWSALGTTPSGPFWSSSAVFRPWYSVKELSPATMTSMKSKFFSVSNSSTFNGTAGT